MPLKVLNVYITFVQSNTPFVYVVILISQPLIGPTTQHQTIASTDCFWPSSTTAGSINLLQLLHVMITSLILCFQMTLSLYHQLKCSAPFQPVTTMSLFLGQTFSANLTITSHHPHQPITLRKETIYWSMNTYQILIGTQCFSFVQMWIVAGMNSNTRST